MTNNESTISERIELMNIVGKNADNLESAMLLINNFKHIKWHTVYNFWKELSDTLVLSGYTITKAIDNGLIDNAIHGGARKKKVSFDLCFTSESGIPLTINCDYGDDICYGVFEATGKYTKEIKRKVKALIETEGQPYECTGYWLYWNYFEPEEGGELAFCFSEFERTPTYRLILPQKRKEYIEHMISIINEFVSKLEKL